MNTITVDFDRIVGKIKPFHGINNAPIYGADTKLYHYLSEAGIPFSRLHDTGGKYGGGVYVDIENLFRDFDADETDPASYDFAFTDFLINNIKKQGTDIIFRLGATIENDHFVRAYHIFPPKDNLKWAKICEGIIKHYNCGWANGFHLNIRYWEIWNEPDNEPEIADNPMWKGTKEQYFKLYEVASNYLKQKFPDIKIGGYASCGFYALFGGFVGCANSSPRTEYFIEFFQAFLQYISSTEHHSPLDFFSWHSYADSRGTVLAAKYVREQLDRYGFGNAETMLNEWNPGIHRRGTEADACYILEMMLKLHGTPLDIMAYYDGQIHGSYNGLFDPVKLDIFPAYYAFHSYNELYKLKNEAFIHTENEEIPILAAADGKMGKILISNIINEDMHIRVAVGKGWKAEKFRVLSGTDGLAEADFTDCFVIPKNKIALIEFCAKQAIL